MDDPIRLLFCPICGAKVEVPADLPSVNELPEHRQGRGGNICQAYRVIVVFARATCAKCGNPMMKHPAGVCQKCNGELLETTNA